MTGKQEALWRGKFGDEYTDRNAVSAAHHAALVTNWSRILHSTMGRPPQSVLEAGANIGLNLRALRVLLNAEMYAVEPNGKARKKLVENELVEADKALDCLCSEIALPDASVDMAFTSGVLIHVPPDQLLPSCRELHRISRRYIVCIEYFSDKPDEIPYRGHTEALFKRDFGGFYLDHFEDLRVLDYGFAWKRITGLDNLTWWLFEKEPS